MNPSTLIFLGLAVVWAIVLLPEVIRKLSGSRSSDSIRSFNHQLSVLHRRSASPDASRSNVIDLRSRPGSGSLSRTAPGSRPAPSVRPVPVAVRKRRQDVLTALGSAAVLMLVCTVAFGGIFLLPLVISGALLVAYVAMLNQLNQAPRTSNLQPSHMRAQDGLAPAYSQLDGLRTATVGRATPAPRRIAN